MQHVNGPPRARSSVNTQSVSPRRPSFMAVQSRSATCARKGARIHGEAGVSQRRVSAGELSEEQARITELDESTLAFEWRPRETSGQARVSTGATRTRDDQAW